MGKVRILKRQGKAYVELPEGMQDYDELELFPLKEGYYLLSTPLGAKRTVAKGLSDVEKRLLNKLLAIRFEKRIPPYVLKVLSDAEKEMLKDLQKRGHVNVFKGKKYQDGVYNISDRTYPLLKGKEAPKKAAAPRPQDSFALLRSQGFAILKDRREAYDLSQRLKQEGKGSAFKGVKGFDGRFYVVTTDYLSKSAAAISSALKEDMDIASIADAAKIDRDGCMAVLRLMAEGGEIIEKKKGVFSPI
jgi:hypothetical protein